MVYRVYVEKKPGLDNEARALLAELRGTLGIERLTGLRLLNRYDVENLDEAMFRACVGTVFSEPQLDRVYDELPNTQAKLLAVEYLPGQFDQRADSAAQCIQIIAQSERPTVKSAKVYLLEGPVTEEDLSAIRGHVINPVEAREADLALPDTLETVYEIPTSVDVLEGFNDLDEAGLNAFLTANGLAMDLADIQLCQRYFRSEGRAPTITEIKVLDTYWSDHCRHTTFNTVLDSVEFQSPQIQATWQQYLDTRRALGREEKPICLMDLGTIAAKALKAEGRLKNLDESEEINACTVKIKATIDGETQDWLLLFKNETHNHPTEIEPFGGAATCVGGAIRDPLSGRSYVYQAMRVTGAGDPTVPLSDTLPGKLPQRKLTTTAAAGYSSYGNQIGLSTGLVHEFYHPGYIAKRLEIGAVVGAAPASNVVRLTPEPGDRVILLGGRTGRDGCGGATGSSKSHTSVSLETCSAEVQKGNAPEERKLQRLFRNPEASRLIKRCNDFGAGGVSVAVGELADGLSIDLNKVPKKYEGLDGTELAIAESQERMAVVVEAKDAPVFLELSRRENLEATVIATVTAEPRLVMRWNGRTIVDLSRAFLDTNGAEKHAAASVAAPVWYEAETPTSFAQGMKTLAGDLMACSRRGLAERFDSTIGAGTVLMPFGGRYQLTPTQAMVNLISSEKGHTGDCSFMSWGFDPYIMEASPYHGAYLSVVSSVCKLIAAGADMEDVYLSFQEYFARLRTDPQRWGLPLSALLGAFQAQMDLGVAAIGGKDSMSGSFEQLDVPPTLISFAVTTGKAENAVSPEFKQAGHRVAWLRPDYVEGLPTAQSLRACLDAVARDKPYACWTLNRGGAAEGILNMCLGNGLGFRFAEGVTLADLFQPNIGSFLLETDADLGETLGYVTNDGLVSFQGEAVSLAELQAAWEGGLEEVYPVRAGTTESVEAFSFAAETHKAPALGLPRPQALIPVFPGTNCEYDTAKALEDAGAQAEVFVINNLSAAAIAQSVEDFTKKLRQANIVLVPGGFSGGDEPEGSGKFIVAFFRNARVTEGVRDLLKQRDGLMCGICNGFQALVKLGLVPYGDIVETTPDSPTLTYNVIGRHQSRIVRTRVASSLSPWLSKCEVGDIHTVAISNGEGRFVASPDMLAQLKAAGQIATQYVSTDGVPSMNLAVNPSSSMLSIEGITSPDGRVLGKMGHSERWQPGLYKNVPGNCDMGLFRSMVRYFA